ncbi:YbaB/EbfC family nucleoid-associated protein [Lentzea kentuckyensis]|uniref:YbaB/EbfC family nucleoid-associated protein n=1 Tax=Lentzea kentuckyensis TaxID=360086 RepID=UPI000A36DBA0|nr:YbaB/EbfC family nucleoid-associated protein [Lentzea kentuckyensis]
MASLNELENLVAERTREFRALKQKAAEHKVIGEPVAGAGLVQVDTTGRLVGIEFDQERLRSLDERLLGRLLVDAIRAAEAKAATVRDVLLGETP